MRITTNMMNSALLTSLNKSLVKQNNLQQELSDGLSIHEPSDDPVKTVRSLGFSSNLAVNNQLTQNLKDAQSWMTSTESATTDMNSVMNQVNTLVVSADNTKSSSDLNTIGKQVDELINQMVSIGNTQIGNRYIFGGQNDSTQPFTRETIKDPNSDKTVDAVVYNGDNNKISMTTTPGAVNPGQDSVNLTGEDIFGASTSTYGQQTLSVFNHLMDIKNQLEQTTSVSQTNSAGGTGTVSGAYTGNGYQNYDIRLDSVDSTTGQVTGASSSTDGGTTWTAVAPASLTSGNPSVIKLADGVNFSITASTKNVAHTTGSTGDVYSFQVPQTPFTIDQSNSAGGAATITGTYTGGDTSTAYTVRATGTNASGQVTGAQYSTDGGSNWSTLSNYTVSQSNSSVGAATVAGTDTNNYTVKIGSVDSSGKITAADYSADGGLTWNTANVTDTLNSDSSTSAVVSMGTGGNTLTIASNTYNKAGDTYASTYVTPPVVNTTDPTTTALTLPNGLTLNVASNTSNAANDTFAFKLPQGTGPNVSWLTSTGIQYVGDDQRLQTNAVTQLGARMSMYEMAANMMQDQNTNIQTDAANNDGVDEAKTITDFNTAQTVYKYALAVGAKIMQTSLVDFLK